MRFRLLFIILVVGALFSPAVFSNDYRYQVESEDGNFYIYYMDIEDHPGEACITSISSDFYSCEIAVIPEQVPGEDGETLTVTEIGHNERSTGTGFKKIVFPRTLKYVSPRTFNEQGLVEVDFNHAEVVVGGIAFLRCANLTTLSNCENVTKLEDAAFGCCPQLEDVSQLLENVTELGKSVFYECVGIERVIINDQIQYLPNEVFYGCKSLKEVVIGNGVTQIDSYAFSGCVALERVVIGENVKSIGEYAFRGCESLSDLTMSDSVELIDEGAFNYCSSLREFTIPASLDLNNYHLAWKECNILIVYNHTPVKDYFKVDGWFGYVDANAQIVFERDDVLDGDYWFRENGNESMLVCYVGKETEALYLPENYKGFGYKIGPNAFREHTELLAVNIPNKVTEIGDNAFYGCSNLISLRAGTGVRVIGEQAFVECGNLQKVIMRSSTVPKMSNSFDKSTTRVAYAPASNYGKYGDLYVIEMPMLINTFESDGVVYTPISTSDRTCYALDCTYSPDDTNIVIGETVTYNGRIEFTVTGVGKYIFADNPYVTDVTFDYDGAFPDTPFINNENLRTLTIGSGIDSESKVVFGNVNLERLTIADSEKVLNLGSGMLTDVQIEHLYLGRNVEDGAFAGITSLTDVTCGDNVTIYPNQCFMGCSNLAVLDFKPVITQFRKSSFEGTALTSLRVPASTTDIWGNCFDNTPIESLYFEDSETEIYMSCGWSTTNLQQLYLGRNIAVYNGAYSNYNLPYFSDCASLHTVIMSDNVSMINDDMFSECTALENLQLPTTIKSIGRDAFENTAISSIYLPEELESVGAFAFYKCGNLKQVTLNTKTLGERAFASTQLEDVKLTATKVYDKCFKDIKTLKHVYIAAEELGTSIFEGCENLLTAECGAPFTKIGASTFKDCVKLCSVTLAEGITELSEKMFYNTPALYNITFPSSLLKIDAEALRYSGLKRLSLPGRVENVGKYAFADLPSLKDIILEDEIPNPAISWRRVLYFADYTVFANTEFETLRVGRCTSNSESYRDHSGPFTGHRSLKKVVFVDRGYPDYYMFYGCWGLESVELPEGMSYICDGAFMSTGLTTIDIPESIKSIPYECFSSCRKLKKINMPGVTSIGGYAFYNTGIESFVVSPTIKKIDMKAFQDCLLLREFRIEASESPLTISNLDMFTYSPLERVFIGRDIDIKDENTKTHSLFGNLSTLTSVEFGEAVTTVSDNLLMNCYTLDDVHLGSNIESIGNSAFSGCSLLSSVILGPKVEKVGNKAFIDCGALAEIWSQAQTPPECGYSVFDGVNTLDCMLYVPEGRVDSYMSANQWEQFFFSTLEGEAPAPALKGIGLNEAALYTQIGEDARLTVNSQPTVAPITGDIVWTSSDESVATVAEGVVTPVAEGECDITVTVGSLNATCHIYVERGKQTLQWTQNLEGLAVGDEIELTAYSTKGLDVMYEITSGEEIASVDGNKLSILGLGEFEISASQPGDECFEASNTMTRTVLVLPVYPKALKSDKVYLPIGESQALELEFDPINVTDKTLLWESLDESIVTVDADGVITGVSDGKTWVVATANNGVSLRVPVIVYTPGVNDPYIPGDANSDGQISVIDITIVVSIILGNTPEGVILEACDLNGDGSISVSDITRIVALILSGDMKDSMSRSAMADAEMLMSKVEIEPSGACEAMIGISDPEAVGMQFEMFIPEGLAVSEIEAADAGRSLGVAWREIEPGKVRVVAYSTDGRTIDDGSLKVSLVADGSLIDGEQIVLSKAVYAVAVGHTMVERTAAGCSSEVTVSVSAIDDVAADAACRIYVEGRTLVVEAPAHCTLVVSSASGMYHVIQAEAGVNHYDIAQPGLIIVNGTKLLVK